VKQGCQESFPRVHTLQVGSDVTVQHLLSAQGASDWRSPDGCQNRIHCVKIFLEGFDKASVRHSSEHRR